MVFRQSPFATVLAPFAWRRFPAKGLQPIICDGPRTFPMEEVGLQPIICDGVPTVRMEDQPIIRDGAPTVRMEGQPIIDRGVRGETWDILADCVDGKIRG